MLFISSKKLFSISRYLNFCISDFPSLFLIVPSRTLFQRLIEDKFESQRRHELSKEELNSFYLVS